VVFDPKPERKEIFLDRKKKKGDQRTARQNRCEGVKTLDPALDEKRVNPEKTDPLATS